MPSKKPTRLRASAAYSDQQVEEALTALAIGSGSPTRARELLAEQWDVPPPHVGTLKKWIEKYHEKYAVIRADVLPRMKGKLIDSHADLAQRLADMESEATTLLEGKLDDMNGRDLAILLKHIATASAIHTDKMRLLRGEATSIVRRELPEIMRALEAKGLVIEGTAEEIPAAPELPTSVPPAAQASGEPQTG